MPEWKALVRARLGRLPVDAAREMDIVDELAQHVAEHHKELIANGVDAERAVELALAPLAERAAQEIARADRPRVSAPPPPTGGSILGAFARDARYGLRLLRRAPSFAAAATITLALGIGANVAIFSVVRAVILRPPAYRDPSGVIAFINSRPGGGPGSITSSSLPDYEDWQRQMTLFDSVGLMSGWTFNLSGLDLPERIFGARVSDRCSACWARRRSSAAPSNRPTIGPAATRSSCSVTASGSGSSPATAACSADAS